MKLCKWLEKSRTETKILIKIDSACRNQQGNCNVVENSAQPFFYSIVIEFMQ